ncbi:MaoC family dehydratase [Rhodovulum sp. DZ06]|uniref:MaoC family dehydratase n=1 Tax=Rhodovulum sp. DZ06 TaxID=3425126 RepID=UPI003D33639A
MKTFDGLPSPGAPLDPGPAMPLEEFMASAGATGVSDWVEVSQDMIDAFAQLTGDLQFIHVDPARAEAEGPFGGAVAHGFLTLSLLSRLGQAVIRPVEGIASKINYGFDKIRFLAPVPSGARVRGRFTRVSIAEDKPGRLAITHLVEVEIEGQEKPALSAEWLSKWILAEGARA